MVPTDGEGQATILDYWRVVWRAKWWILALSVISGAVAFGAGLLQPKIYTARVTIMSPTEAAPQALSSSLGSLLFGGGGGSGGREGGGLSLPGVSLGLARVSGNEDKFVAFLKSRTLKEGVIGELSTKWGPSVGSMVDSIEPDTKLKGVIGLTVDARDPELAAEVANASPVWLERRLERSSEEATRRQGSVLSEQLDRAAKELQVAEGTLLKFQTENRVLGVVDGAAKGMAESAAMLRGSVMALEMQREMMRMRLTDQHPQARELDKQIAELKRQYSRNLFGSAMDLPPEGPGSKGNRKEFFVPAEKMTPVQFSFLKLYRNLKIQEAFYVTALQGLQQIKYGDGLNPHPPSVEVLDPAIRPSRPSRPNIATMVTAATLSALVAGILLAFILEYVAQVRERERQARPVGATRRKRPDERSADGELIGTLSPGGVPLRRAVGPPPGS